MKRADREAVELCLTIQTPGGCVSHRLAGMTLESVVAQWPDLLARVQRDWNASLAEWARALHA